MVQTDNATALMTLSAETQAITSVRLPPEVRRQAGLALLDTLGCMLAGTLTEEAPLVLSACERGSGSIRIPGASRTGDAIDAATASAYLGDVLELNDLIGGHASIGNVAAAFAIAQQRRASGEQLLLALVRGIETTTRVYGAVYPTLKRYTEMGLVPVGIPSSIGAAAAVATLLELDQHQTAHAMAIAGTLAGWCPAEVIFGEGGTVKPMLFGAQPAAAGIQGARHAQRGMTGPLRLLDSHVGYFATVSEAGQLAPPAVTDQREWALARPRRKLHACCGYIHSPVDALDRLRKQAGPPSGAIQVHVAPYVADVVSKSRLPVSPNDARFHLQYCLAQVLCGASVILPEHSLDMSAHLERADLREAMASVIVEADPALSHYHQCRIAYRTLGGGLADLSLDAPRGSDKQPLNDAEVREKFMRLGIPVIGESQALRAVELVEKLEELDDIGALAACVALQE